MNKASLKKLSKSQLIKLLLKQEKSKPSPSVKPKQKVIYNHDNLFNDNPFKESPFERTLRGVNKQNKNIDKQTASINDKYSKLFINEKKVTHYPMIKATVDEFRKEEIKISDDKHRRLKSFVDLDKKRLDDMEGKREKVSIRIHIKLSHVLRGMNETVSEHTYGPFTTYKPNNMSKRDEYKFALYTHE